MSKERACNEIEVIIKLLLKYQSKHPAHADSVAFLVNKFKGFLSSIIDDNSDLEEYIEWTRYFATRIIFDGINDKEILASIDKLNIALKE